MKMPVYAILLIALSLGGCDQITQRLGLEDPGAKETRLENDAKAVGSACRHSGRAIEDCYSIYSWLPRAGIFAGWKEMDAYMRENQLETIAPQLPPPEPPSNNKKKKKPAAAEATGEGEAKKEADSATKSEGKSAEKAAEKH
jgi:hypothetical protein